MHAELAVQVGGSQVAAYGASSQSQPYIDLAGHSNNLSCRRSKSGGQHQNRVTAPHEDDSQKGQRPQIVPILGIFIMDSELPSAQQQGAYYSQHAPKGKGPRGEPVVGNVQSPQDLAVEFVAESPYPAQEEDLAQSYPPYHGAKARVERQSCSHCVQERRRSVGVIGRFS